MDGNLSVVMEGRNGSAKENREWGKGGEIVLRSTKISADSALDSDTDSALLARILLRLCPTSLGAGASVRTNR
jgi:hypothetical protein